MTQRRIERLSPREYAVFSRIARGETLATIADALGVAGSTVSTYRSRVLEKLGANSNAELAVIAHSAGVVRSPRARRIPA